MLTLQELVKPLSVDDFLRDFFLPAVPFVSAANPATIEALAQTPEFAQPEHLLRAFERVTLFGRDGFRSAVPGRVAMDFYRRGDTLYLTGVERVLPGLVKLFHPVASELGVPVDALAIELFIARAGAISTLHYDHDVNFQILISGSKRWLACPNRHIINPLMPNHRVTTPREEAFARRIPFPTIVDELEEQVRLDAAPGTCTFVPLGCWHQVEMLEDSFAVNLALRPTRLVDAISGAARRALIRDEEMRAPVWGALAGANPLLIDLASRLVRDGYRKYGAALSTLGFDEVGLARQGHLWRWAPSHSTPRKIEVNADVSQLLSDQHSLQPYALDPRFASLVRRLAPFRGAFCLDDLRALEPDLSSQQLVCFANEMTKIGYFVEAG